MISLEPFWGGTRETKMGNSDIKFVFWLNMNGTLDGQYHRQAFGRILTFTIRCKITKKKLQNHYIEFACVLCIWLQLPHFQCKHLSKFKITSRFNPKFKKKIHM